MNDKKYQVFISSTYTDLKEERRKILDILLMADCIPAGMEAFVATDSEQFEVIKKIIDLCDYYILIIGKRYGSINPKANISYTEMEYEYAKSKGIPVLVFAIDETISLPEEKTETDSNKIQMLAKFRNKAMDNTLATIWKSDEDLISCVAISIMKAKTEIKRPGWQRATDYDEASLRREIMEKDNENIKLKDELTKVKKEISQLTKQSNLAFEDVPIKIEYNYTYWYDHHSETRDETINTNLEKIFCVIATEMMDVSITEQAAEDAILQQLTGSKYSSWISDKQLIKKILNQFKELGYMNSHWSDKHLYWSLTPVGTKIRNDMILMHKES